MNKLAILLLAAAVSIPSLARSEQRVYDRYGQNVGRIDPNGRVYDRYGQNQGRIDPDGRIYDRYGRNVGRVDPPRDTPPTTQPGQARP